MCAPPRENYAALGAGVAVSVVRHITRLRPARLASYKALSARWTRSVEDWMETSTSPTPKLHVMLTVALLLLLAVPEAAGARSCRAATEMRRRSAKATAWVRSRPGVRMTNS